MVEKTNTPSDFITQMLDVQQQYLNNLGQMFQAGQPAVGESPFDAWFKQLPVTGHSGFDEFFRNLAEASLSIVRNPTGDLASMLQGGQLPTGWYEALQGQFSDWLNTGSAHSVFEQMNERLRQQLLTPFNFDAGFNPAAAGFNPAGLLDSSVLKLLQGLYNLEEKQTGEQLLKTLELYQQQVMQMNHMMAQVGIESIQTLQTQFEEGTDTDLNRVYQSWKEISEKVFTELKLDDRYRELKASMRKIEEQLQSDLDQYRQALIEQLGLVTRQEYDALRQELETLRAEVADLAGAKPAAQPSASVKGGKESSAADSGSENAGNDDFTVLKGIGDKFNQKLHEQGIHTLSQLAAMNDEMLKSLDENLNTNGRLFQQQWREQAEQLVKKLTR